MLIRLIVRLSESAMGTYGLLFSMKTVDKFIIGVIAWSLVGLCKLINTVSTSKIAHNMQCWYVLTSVRLSVYLSPFKLTFASISRIPHLYTHTQIDKTLQMQLG